MGVYRYDSTSTSPSLACLCRPCRRFCVCRAWLSLFLLCPPPCYICHHIGLHYLDSRIVCILSNHVHGGLLLFGVELLYGCLGFRLFPIYCNPRRRRICRPNARTRYHSFCGIFDSCHDNKPARMAVAWRMLFSDSINLTCCHIGRGRV